MNKKLETAIKLIEKSADKGQEQKLFQGICLILEVSDENPDALDPVTKALINPVLKRLIKQVESSLGIDDIFDEDVA